MGKKYNTFNYVVLFILGVLLATQAFIIWQYRDLRNEVSAQRQDISTIVQAYNNLVTELQGQGIGQKN